MLNFQKMMKQAQDVQFKLQEMQEKLKDIDVEGQSGGGLVTVVMTCAGKIRSLSIDPSLLNAEEKETTEDLIVAAINNATEAKETRVESETKAMMEAVGLPEGAKLPF